jgi:hypothetical protein
MWVGDRNASCECELQLASYAARVDTLGAFMSTATIPFDRFYETVFLPEHRHPANVALHVAGTVLGLLLLPAAPWLGAPWAVLLFPVVHAAPGLIGHRWFERDAAVGDVRVLRRDHSPLRFIAANHRMTWELLTRGFHWRG